MRADRGSDPMGDPDFRMLGLCHAMGFCIIATSLSLSLGLMALDLGRDVLGGEMASLSAIALFVLMAGWRSYNVSSGRKTDMGILFLAYGEGRGTMTRGLTRILSILAMVEAMMGGTALMAPFVLIVSIMISEADKFVLMASHRACAENKLNEDGSQSGAVQEEAPTNPTDDKHDDG
jgi:hypothetical protein